MKWHIKKNDTISVVAGEDKGKTGRVLKIMTDKSRVIVEGVNFVKRHLKKGHPQAPQGGIVQKESSIHISNVMVVCTKCNKPTKTYKKELADEKKVRVCKKCGEIIDKV